MSLADFMKGGYWVLGAKTMGDLWCRALGCYPNGFSFNYPMEDFIAKLFIDYKRDEAEFYVSTDTWRQLSKDFSLSLTETFDSFGTHLAKMYQKGDLNYEFCDALVNIAFSDWLGPIDDESEKWPADFYEVYEAFDAGEYYRKDDKSDDPVADHTDPMIREFLERIRSNV